MLMAMKQPGLDPLRLKLYLRKTQIAREHPSRSGSGVWFSASVHAVSHGQGSFHAVGSLSANLGLILKILTVSECPQGTHAGKEFTPCCKLTFLVRNFRPPISDDPKDGAGGGLTDR